MTSRDMAGWLEHYFRAIEPALWGDDPCWVAFMKTREPEHNPPFYWLGRALDAVEAGGARDTFAARLLRAHGAPSCGGSGDRDQRVQDVLSEACAYAWTVAHLGPVELEPAEEGATLEAGPIRLHVAAHDAYVAPLRLWPVRTLQEVVRQIGTGAAEAGRRLPRSSGRILYVDTWHEQMYAQNLGYRLELTEPLQDALRFYAVEFGLGHVLTRPFQWGNPVEAWY